MLIEGFNASPMQMRSRNGKEVDLTQIVEVIQVKARKESDMNHYYANSKSRLCRTIEEDEMEIGTMPYDWNEYGRYEVKNDIELETDVKTPESNHLSTKGKLIFNSRHSTESHGSNDNQIKVKYDGNKVYRDITSYSCSFYDEFRLKEFLFRPLGQDKALYCNLKIASIDNRDEYCAVIQGNDFKLMTIKRVEKYPLQAAEYHVLLNKSNVIGKIKGNFLSTCFTFYQKKPKQKVEQGNVQYKLNPFGLFGLRKMTISLPQSKGQAVQYINKKANWSKEYKAYRLDFNSRAKKASNKNFIIENTNREKILQFGQIDEDTYAMDFQSPLSPFQAFSLCATSIISKSLCE